MNMNSSSAVENKSISLRSNDIDEILVRSQRLVAMHQQSQGSGYHSSSSSSSDNRNVINKGISELSDYTKQLQAQSTSDHHNTEAFRLLSQKNFDAKKLYEDLSAINVEMMDNDSSSVRLEGTDIEGYLAHHHDMIILTTIEDVRRGAEDHMHEMQRRWAAAEWSTARAKFMDDVGHKSHSWEGSSAMLTTTPRDKRLMTPQASDSRSILLSPSVRRSFAGQSAVPAMSAGFRAPLSELMQAQSSIIRRLNLQSHSTNSSTAAAAMVKPYSLLYDCIKVPDAVTAVNAVVSDGLFKSDLVAYTSHLQLMSFAVGERSIAADISSRPNAPVAAGYFSPISVDTGDVFNAVVDGRRSLLTRGSMQFFEQQIQDVWMLTLDDALSAGTWTVLARSEGTNRQQRLKSYVAYLSHMNQLPPGCRELCVASSSTTQPSASGGGFTSGYGLNGGGKPVGSAVSLWAYLYHCVRSGQMDLAQAELEQWVSREYDNGQSSVLSVLQLMMLLKTKITTTAAASGGGGGGGGASVSRQQRAVSSEPLLRDNEVRLLHESILQCRSFYERELRSEEDQSMQDPYRCMLFNLFGLADKDGLAGSSIPGFSLEDFMWSNLWFIDNVRLLKPSLTNLSDSLIASERSLFGLVMEYGGCDYFDADRSNPFRYAMVLSCCQRFGDAIAHLWQCNKAIPAVHLIVAALHYGLILPHLPLHMNPSLPMVMGGKTYFNLNQQEPTPADVLQLFVKSSLLNKHPVIAVDYLVSLDSNWLVHATIESDAKDISKVKCQSIVTSVFEGFLMQLSRDQLGEVVGTPLPMTMQSNTPRVNKTSRTSGGRLDDYFSAHQVDMLLNSCAFNLLTYHKDVESAIYYYELSGQLTEAMEQLCIQLTNVFMPPQLQSTTADAASTQLYQGTRDKWRAISKQFIIEFLQTSSSSSYSSVDQSNAASSDFLALRDSLLVIMSLMEFVDDVVHSSADVDYTQALAVLDKHNILPTNEQQIDHFSSINNPYLRRIMDDVLIVAMDCTLAAFRQTKADRMRDSMNPAVSHSLKQRATALRMFAYKIKSRLNRLETPSVLVNMEAVLIN